MLAPGLLFEIPYPTVHLGCGANTLGWELGTDLARGGRFLPQVLRADVPSHDSSRYHTETHQGPLPLRWLLTGAGGRHETFTVKDTAVSSKAPGSPRTLSGGWESRLDPVSHLRCVWAAPGRVTVSEDASGVACVQAGGLGLTMSWTRGWAWGGGLEPYEHQCAYF